MEITGALVLLWIFLFLWWLSAIAAYRMTVWYFDTKFPFSTGGNWSIALFMAVLGPIGCHIAVKNCMAFMRELAREHVSQLSKSP